MNLHMYANPMIAILHPNRLITYYRSIGTDNSSGTGIPVNKYAEGVVVEAQIQSMRADELYHSGNVARNESMRKVWLFAPSNDDGKAANIIRQRDRSGDYALDDRGLWWAVTALDEDFTEAEWNSVYFVAQVKGPDFSHSDWYVTP